MSFLDGASGKEPTCPCRRRKRLGFDPWIWKVLWRRKWQPTPVFLPGEPHGQRSLAGDSPGDRRGSDTERLSTEPHKEQLCSIVSEAACCTPFPASRSFQIVGHLFSFHVPSIPAHTTARLVPTPWRTARSKQRSSAGRLDVRGELRWGFQPVWDHREGGLHGSLQPGWLSLSG